MYPYVMNPTKDTVGRTLNRNDPLFPDSHGPEGKYNPVFDLHLLGGVVSHGFIGYITMVFFYFILFLNCDHSAHDYFVVSAGDQCKCFV
jgi:hypothetical protein